MATMSPLEGFFSGKDCSSEKPRILKEAIAIVLKEAGPEGLTLKEIVQRIKKKKWWGWKDDEQGYYSVSGICRSPDNCDVFVRVAPGTYSLWALQDDDFTPYVKPTELKETIINVLQEAGPGGLTLKEMVQRIKKNKWWDWKDDEQGYDSVSSICGKPRNHDVFVRVAPGTWTLWSLQDDDFTPYEKPMELKEAIILVLQEAGPGGLTVKEIVQRMKKKFSWDWENDKQGSVSVSSTCGKPRNHDVFVRVAYATYALSALQDDDFDPNEKPRTLKEAVIIVLQEAGPEGLHIKEIVQRIKKKKWWDWENDEAGYHSVSATCRESNNGDVFAHVAPGTWALWALQDHDFTPCEKPVKSMELKEAIILVLQEAGPGGLHIKEIAQRIKKKELWDWKTDKAGSNSVSAVCSCWRDACVRVAPGTWALRALQDDGFTPYEKPKTMKECVILVLQEAGPEGLHAKEIVQRIKKKELWDWENDEQGYVSVASACHRAPDVFVKHFRGVYALKSLQGEVEEAEGSAKALAREKPMGLKEAIILVLQEAGPGGLAFKEIVQRIKKKKWWDWENDEQGYNSVSRACPKYPDVFVKHSRGVYALKSLQGEVEEAEGSAKALAREKAGGDAERTASAAKRTREAASGSGDESTQVMQRKLRVVEECVEEELQSNAVPTEDRRLLLPTDEQKETMDLCFQSVEGNTLAKGSADRCKGIEAVGIGARPSETASDEKSYSDLTFIRVSDYTNSELKAIADADNKKIGVQSHIFV